MKQSFVKKHAFWLLFGAVPLLVLIGVVTIMSAVGGATAAKMKEYTDSKTTIAGAKPKGKALAAELVKQKGQLDTKVTSLWGENFLQQKRAGLFKWPAGTARADSEVSLAWLERLDLPWGDTFDRPVAATAATADAAPATGPAGSYLDADRSAFIEYASERDNQSVYLKAYRQMAESVAPTQWGTGTAAAPGGAGGAGEGPGGGMPRPGMPSPSAPGAGAPGGTMQSSSGDGWRAVLRHVTNWGVGDKPTVPQFWLALEDFWVQRELVTCVARTNKALTEFKPEFSFWNYNPLKRTFVSRLWALDLEVVTEGNRKYLKATIRNQTDRLQLLGAGKVMRLRVWLDNPADEPATFGAAGAKEYVLGGELVPGKSELDVPLQKTDPKKGGKDTVGPHAISLDRAITRISKVEQILDEVNVPVKLIQSVELGVTDHRRAMAEFKSPKLKGLPEDAPADGANPPAGQPGTPAAPPGGGLDGPGGRGGLDGRGGPGEGGAGATTRAKTGTADAVLINNRQRYLEVTDQVRRMPVALAVVLDGAFQQDLLVQFTNSPMRFHVTQTGWQRFRGTLPTTQSSTPGGSGKPPGGSVPGPGGPGGQGMPGVGEGGDAGSAAAATAQANAGLITLSVYGVVSLYAELPVVPIKPEADDKLEGLGSEWKTPVVVKNDADLEKLVPDADTRARFRRQLELRTHDLMAFAWEGAEDDKLTFTVTDQTAKFTLSPGKSETKQQFRQLYAIRRTLKWTAD